MYWLDACRMRDRPRKTRFPAKAGGRHARFRRNPLSQVLQFLPWDGCHRQGPDCSITEASTSGSPHTGATASSPPSNWHGSLTVARRSPPTGHGPSRSGENSLSASRWSQPSANRWSAGTCLSSSCISSQSSRTRAPYVRDGSRPPRRVLPLSTGTARRLV